MQQQIRPMSCDWVKVSQLVSATKSGQLTPEQRALIENLPKEDAGAFQAMLQEQQM